MIFEGGDNLHIHNLTAALPKGKGSYKTRLLSEIDTIVVHHSATRQGDARAFARYHIENNGWPGIGYHYILDKSGRCYKCQPANVVSYHASGYNSCSIGVCMVGDFDSEQPTQAQLDALVELCRELVRAYGIRQVVGHREVPGTHKTCPGRNVDMESIKDAVFGGEVE
jgi:N-acetyl-anhydromuramyl-L-alanine amidase AmpD